MRQINPVIRFAVASSLGLASAASWATTAPSITSILTGYSALGTPTSLTIAGSGFCATTSGSCATKPTISVNGTSLTVSTATATSVTATFAVAPPDGDYTLTLTAGTSASVNYGLTVESLDKGPTGPTGPTGVTGGTGPAGPAGAKGSTGATGVTGGTGPAGATGAAGAKGSTGATGPTGATGATGAAGSAGAQGLMGATGPQGLNGLNGLNGFNGATGATGPAGPQGLAGATGPTGATGATGATGVGLNFRGAWSSSIAYVINDLVTLNGSAYLAVASGTNQNPATDAVGAYWKLLVGQGATGPTGLSGTVGATGPAGATGATGSAGPTGPQGSMGVSGPMGPIGPPGIQGIQGIPGPTGPAGPGSGLPIVSANGTFAYWSNGNWVALPPPTSSGPGLLFCNGGPIWAYSCIAADVTPVLVTSIPFSQDGGTGNLAFDGQNIWLARTSNSSYVAKIRASDASVLGTFNSGTGSATNLAFDGANIWVTDYASGNVVKIRASDGTVIGTTSGGISGGFLAYDGASLWETDGTVGLRKISPSDGSVIGVFPTGGSDPTPVLFDGTSVWVGNYFSANIAKIRPSDGALIGTYSTGSVPVSLAFDGSSIWVASEVGGTVSKLRAVDGSLVGVYSVPAGPHGLAFDGVNIWIAGKASQTLTRLRASDGACVGVCTISLPATPEFVLFDGSNLWVAQDGLLSKFAIGPNTVPGQGSTAQGPTGSAGPTGPAGPTGAIGPQGPAGVAGTPGSQGPQGPQGLMGVPGSQGPTGPTGAPGPGATVTAANAGNCPNGGATITDGAGNSASACNGSSVGGVNYNLRGVWNSSTTYAVNDLVFTKTQPSGASYTCQFLAIAPSLGAVPFTNSDPTLPTEAWIAFDPACRSITVFHEGFESPSVATTALTNGSWLNFGAPTPGESGAYNSQGGAFVGDSGNTWTVDVGNVDVQSAQAADGLGWPAHDGIQSIDMNGWVPGSMYTTINLRGGNYLLQFSYWKHPGNAGPTYLDVQFDGVSVAGSPFISNQAPVAPESVSEWLTVAVPISVPVDLVNSVTAHTLRFTSLNSSNCCDGPALDDVRISTVP